MSYNIIKINRGDSFEFTVDMKAKIGSLQDCFLTESEAVYFALLYPHQRFEDAIFIKGYNSNDQDKRTGEITIKITPNMTKSLTPGIYYYTVKLQRGGTLDTITDLDEPEEVRTLIERTKFIIND